MSSLVDLLNLPADQLELRLVQDLVDQRAQEGFTLEYKSQLGDGGSTLAAIAAMANTFGGLVLVGIEEDREKGSYGFPGARGIIGVDPVDRSRIVNWCLGRLVPPVAPEVTSLDTGKGRVVLVVRVPERDPRRPITFERRVPVRSENGNEYADRWRLEELFQESPVVNTTLAGFAGRSPEQDAVWSEEPPPDLFVRLSSSIPVVAAGRRIHIPDQARDALADSLNRSELGHWLRGELKSSGFNEWHAEGHSTATNAQLRWQGVVEQGSSAYPEAHCTLAVPDVGSGFMSCDIDVILRLKMLTLLAQRTMPQAFIRLDPIDVLDLLVALLETFAEFVVPAAHDLVRAPVGAPLGPTCTITTHGRPIIEAIDLGSLQLVPGNQAGGGTVLYLDVETRLDELEGRRGQAVAWMRRLLQDCHYRGVDALVDPLERAISAD